MTDKLTEEAINAVLDELLDAGRMVVIDDDSVPKDEQMIVDPTALPVVPDNSDDPKVYHSRQVKHVTVEVYDHLIRACFIAAGCDKETYDAEVKPMIDAEMFDNDGMPIVAYPDGVYDQIKDWTERVAWRFEPGA